MAAPGNGSLEIINIEGNDDLRRPEYDFLGEESEDNEYKLFGKDGFESMVNKVADIEEQLGIFELL